MNLSRQLIAVVAAAATMGSAQAQNTFNLDPLSATIQERTDIRFGVDSFMDVFNFTVDASNRTVNSSMVKLAPDGTVSLTHFTGLKYELFSGFDAAGTTPLSTDLLLDDSARLNLSALLDPGDFSARISGRTGDQGGGFRLSVAANPEPAEWMMLLAGLVVVAFIARRKTSLVAG